jgi:hypothetical protein
MEKRPEAWFSRHGGERVLRDAGFATNAIQGLVTPPSGAKSRKRPQAPTAP